jgi:hypothetical protein
MRTKLLAGIAARDRRCRSEPLYDLDPQTGATIEVFYANPALAKSLGMGGAGWCWWTCQSGGLPGRAIGSFATSYRAYRDALRATGQLRQSAE